MRNKILLLLAIISTCLSINAQIKIDFSNGTGNKAYVSDGYTDWHIDDITKNNLESNTFGDVTIKIGHGDNTQGEKITRSLYNNGIAISEESKLICDGIYACLNEDNSSIGDGKYGATDKRVEIDITISGLEIGTYTLTAFHNYLMDASHILPTIGVEVDGAVKKTGITQTQRKTNLAEAAYSVVALEVTKANQEIVVTYFSEPKDGESYTRTYFFINSLELGTNVVEIDDKVKSAYPANLDYHVDADGGSVDLTWDTPKNGANSYIVYFGENQDEIENAESGGTSQSNLLFRTPNLSPLKRYYWRVDVVRGGVTYKGDVWSFQPRRDAFPGAEGYGRYAIGGRGYEGNEGKVYHVTSLDDDATNPQPGTFRYGILKETGPRTIVFDVSGVIHLKDRLTCSDPYVTIAGQTAPGNGIMFRGAPLGVASDGITRFVRLRRGDIVKDGTTITITLEKDGKEYTKDVPADCGKGLDGMGMAGNDHSIIDHCSIGWTVDEAFSSRNAKNITLQHTLISEALNIAGHPNYDAGTGHGYAATVGGDKGSLHHNLLAHNAGRNWSMGGGLDGAGYYKDYLDMFNNVCYNWVDRTTDGGVHVGKFVNNYYKMGPSSKKMPLIIAHLQTGAGTQEYYVEGNIRDNNDGTLLEQGDVLYPKGENEGDNSKYAGENYIYTLRNDKNDGRSVFYDSSWIENFDPWASVETANAAFKNVLSDVGCNYAGLDNHDVRMVSETLKGTTSTNGSVGKKAGIIDKTTDSEGFDGLNIETATRPANWDVDGDGIPAWFETAKGWSETAPNNNECSNKDYYTNLEEYLNWVAVPHFYDMANDGTVTALKTGTNHTITLADYFAGYTSPSYTVVSNGGATTSISNNGVLTYNFPANASKLATIQVKATQDGISLTRSFNFFIDASVVEEPEDPTVTPEGTPYTLSTETYKSSTNTTTWNFTPDDLTFTVTNSNNKGYSTGSEKGVKYTAGVQYTIGIPTGIQVDYITFRGYDNYSGTDAYLKELNSTPYGATDYVFPQKDSEGKYTIEEHTIQLANPAKGSLTFTPAGNQVVWVITLHTSKVDVNLPDVENTMEEVADGESSVSANYTIDSSTYTTGTTTQYTFVSNSETFVMTRSSGKEKEDGNSKYGLENSIKYSAEQTFTISIPDGLTITNFKVTGYSNSDSNEGSISKINGNSVSGYTFPTRTTDTTKEQTKTYDIQMDVTDELSFVPNQQCCFVITLTGTKTTSGKKTVVTLDEMATVHNLDAADNVTVEMKRGLTAGAWNTFCVPFDLTKTQLQTALNGSEVEIVEYTSQEGTTLYFEDTDNIEAGKPYLIKPASFSRTYDECKTTPITFSGVDIVEARNVRTNSGTVQTNTRVSPEGADYSFVGTYVRYVLRTDGTEYGLNSSNKLIRPSSSNIMRGLRAFFRIAGGSNSNAKVVIGGELTSIDEIDATANRATGVYHVSGHYVREDWDNGKGLPRGLYIVNGRKMVRK